MAQQGNRERGSRKNSGQQLKQTKGKDIDGISAPVSASRVEFMINLPIAEEELTVISSVSSAALRGP